MSYKEIGSEYLVEACSRVVPSFPYLEGFARIYLILMIEFVCTHRSLILGRWSSSTVYPACPLIETEHQENQEKEIIPPFMAFPGLVASGSALSIY